VYGQGPGVDTHSQERGTAAEKSKERVGGPNVCKKKAGTGALLPGLLENQGKIGIPHAEGRGGNGLDSKMPPEYIGRSRVSFLYERRRET